MSDLFFEKPILNSPYEIPIRHWELDPSGQPTQQITETRRRAEFITPIPKPRKQKGGGKQDSLVFDEGHGLYKSITYARTNQSVFLWLW
jgi:type III restriction enzyme